MRDTWEPNEQRTPVFSTEQAATIRIRLSAARDSDLK
jgi:ribosomal protein L28